MNEIQKAMYDMVRDAICSTVESMPVRYNAIKVITPFLDWVGEYISIYITDDGDITDGERTLNQLKAMRVYENLDNLVKNEGYFDDFNINQIGNTLEPRYIDSADDIIRYIHGIARLPLLFDVNPISDKEDRFPTLVRNNTMQLLMNEYPNRPTDDVLNWAHRLTYPYMIPTKTGINIRSDMRPVNKNKNVQIIGMSNSTDSEKKTHVASKMFNPLYWKTTNRNARTIIVVNDVSNYPKDSQNIMKEEGNPLIEFKTGKTAIMKLAAEIAEA